MELLFIGYNHVHDADLNINRPLGSGDYLALLVKSPAVFTINGKQLHTPPNIFFLYPKGSPQYYRADGESFINDWMHLDFTSEDEQYIRDLKIPLEKPVPLFDIEFFSMLINSLSEEFYSSNTLRKSTIDCFLHIFFNKLSERVTDDKTNMTGKTYDKFSLLRSKIYTRPYLKWSIANLSHQICLSPSYFQHLYKEYFGITCNADIIHARIEYAKQLLKNQSLTVHYVSEQCGYENDVHFMRQFKQNTGLTPTQYRTSLSENEASSGSVIDRNRPDIF